MEKTDIVFDQYQRYETIARLICFQRREEDQIFKILELGSNEHKDLRLFLPEDQILFTDITLTEAMKNDPDFTQADGSDLPFEDGSFDFVVAADVFEHVPRARRKRFVSEALRVSRVGAILSFPHNAPYVLQAERRVNAYYKAVTGKDFIWLKEHMENSLPDPAEIDARLAAGGGYEFHFFHGDIRVWEKMWYGAFVNEFSGTGRAYHSAIDGYYNRNIYPRDISENCYRAFYVLTHAKADDWARCAAALWEADAVNKQESSEFLDTLLSMQQELHGLNEQNRMRDRIAAQDNMLKEYEKVIRRQNERLQVLETAYANVAGSLWWKAIKPLRMLTDGCKKLIKSNKRVYGVFRRIKRDGVVKTFNRLFHKHGYIAYSTRELKEQRRTDFPRHIRIGIEARLCNTPQGVLQEMIKSVQSQTYTNWELHLLDESDAEHAYVGSVCAQYGKEDARIVYMRQEDADNENPTPGEYIGLIGEGDLLHPAALYETMRRICAEGADMIYTDEAVFDETPNKTEALRFKPDYAPDTLRSVNYIGRFCVFSRKLAQESGGGLRERFGSAQEYDLILRLSEKAKCIAHIPRVLYYSRKSMQRQEDQNATELAVQEHLVRVGLSGRVTGAKLPGTCRIDYDLEGHPLVSILIPNKDHAAELTQCVRSIQQKTTYDNWEIVVIENNSVDEATFDCYRELQKDARIRVVRWNREFNYSAINNFGEQFAHGEQILLLNNDTEVITPDWIEQMLMFSQRKDVGGVGAMLYYPDDTVQHAGVIIGLGNAAGHGHRNYGRGEVGYMGRLAIAQNYSAVTAACIMIRRDVWREVGGLDETFAVAYNDVDLCLRICKKGYRIVWTPFAELYHYESKSRGMDDTPEKRARFEGELLRLQSRWVQEMEAGDPAYNPNLTIEKEDFSVR